MEDHEIHPGTTLGELTDVPPIPVTVIDRGPSEKFADANLSSFTTYVMLANGGSVAQQAVPQDRRRHRCILIVTGTAGDYVLLGKQNQVSNGQGARLYAGTSVVLESAAGAWLIPVSAITHDVVVTVIDERYLDSGTDPVG